jgi:hypothetical protein
MFISKKTCVYSKEETWIEINCCTKTFNNMLLNYDNYNFNRVFKVLKSVDQTYLDGMSPHTSVTTVERF